MAQQHMCCGPAATPRLGVAAGLKSAMVEWDHLTLFSASTIICHVTPSPPGCENCQRVIATASSTTIVCVRAFVCVSIRTWRAKLFPPRHLLTPVQKLLAAQAADKFISLHIYASMHRAALPELCSSRKLQSSDSSHELAGRCCDEWEVRPV